MAFAVGFPICLCAPALHFFYLLESGQPVYTEWSVSAPTELISQLLVCAPEA